MAQLKEKPKPFLLPDYCKGCGRCISACARGCISLSGEIDSATGFVPVKVDLEKCNACGLCMDACPEPYGLRETPAGEFEFQLEDPAQLFGAKRAPLPEPVDIPAERVPLPRTEPLVIKGNYASAVGALLAGCRHVYGYPITPSTEGAELMAKLLPKLDGTFLQAVSEVATVNHMYGCGGAGKPCMTFTSSPGFSLMLEGISYMIGAEVPGVFVNIMRGGPGLGNIAPEQADVKLACRGLGHGNTHCICLAPSTPQEMLDLSMLAFDLTFKYRNPVIILADGYLGQMTGKVNLPDAMIKPGTPKWAVTGDAAHRGNLINSIFLSEAELEGHNIYLNGKYRPDGPERIPVRDLHGGRRRGAGHRHQHAGPGLQGRRAGPARPGHQGRPVPAHHRMAVPGPAAGQGTSPREADRHGGGQQRPAGGRSAPGPEQARLRQRSPHLLGAPFRRHAPATG